MYRYDGFVIYQNHDDEGVLEVVEQDGIRSLHFGSNARQSSISLIDPETLQLPYVRAMTSWMLFKDDPENVLMIGLGGGSLARFMLYHFPECRVRVVEYRASVVKIARSHFGLPLDNRLKVVVEDGGLYVRHQTQTNENQFDLIFVDAFDVEGMANSIASVAFFDACNQLLTPNGMLAINLWGSEKALFASCINWLQQAFNGHVLVFPVRNRGNIIALAFKQLDRRFGLKELQEKAKRLEQQYQIEFPVFLKDISKHNTYAIHNIVTK